MKREHDLELRLKSLTTLHQAVLAMKSLSAHHFHAARAALEPARTYRQGIERILDSTGAHLAAGDGARGLVVIGAELGFCGSYNARIAAEGVAYRAKNSAGPTLCLGHRVAAALRRQGVTLDQVYATPSGVGTTHTLLMLAEEVMSHYVEGRLSAFDVIATRFRGVGVVEPRVVRLLPVSRAPHADAPQVRYATASHAAAVAARETLYVNMVELLLDALATEHAARLVATQSAEQWLGERMQKLKRRLSAARRETSTQEVIELATGARVRQRAS